MSEKKHIDKLYKEKFKDFEVSPNEAVWINIEKELNKNKRKRRVIPIWWKVAGIAASLVFLFTVGNLLLNNSLENEVQKSETVVDNDSEPKPKNRSKSTPTENTDTEVNLEETDTSKTNSNFPEVIVDNGINSEGSQQSKSSYDSNGNKLKSDTNGLTNRVIVNSDIMDEIDRPNYLENDKESTKNQNSKAITESLTANKTNKGGKHNNEINPKFISTKSAVSLNKNLSKTKSNSNKSFLNTVIDSSKSDALISNSKLESRVVVTDHKTTAAKDSRIEMDSVQTVNETNAIEEAIALANDEEVLEKEEEEKLNRWSVSPNVAPVYFNSLSNGGSPLDDQFANNSKAGEINMSFGIGGSYSINKKIKIRTGINRVAVGYRTNNVLVSDNINSAFPSASASSDNVNVRQLQNVEVAASHSDNSFTSAARLSAEAAPNILLGRDQISLDQNLGFIEVPIEIEYSLVESKFGLNVIGGFSTLFLNNNEIVAVQDGNSTYFGEATNINDLSYSANLGIGINYNISKQFRFNLEPTFKYQINTFNNTSGDFDPYLIGLYTGLSFKF